MKRDHTSETTKLHLAQGLQKNNLRIQFENDVTLYFVPPIFGRKYMIL